MELSNLLKVYISKNIANIVNKYFTSNNINKYEENNYIISQQHLEKYNYGNTCYNIIRLLVNKNNADNVVNHIIDDCPEFHKTYLVEKIKIIHYLIKKLKKCHKNSKEKFIFPYDTLLLRLLYCSLENNNKVLFDEYSKYIDFN